MKISTTPHRNKIRLWAVLIWLAVWQVASLWVGEAILLASPVSVFLRLVQLCQTGDFWGSLLFSLIRILLGFLLGLLCGGLFAGLAAFLRPVEELLSPLMLVMKTTPITSIIILCLIWIPSRNLSIFTAFLMVFPIIYTNLLEGIRATDPQLIEMAELFQVPWHKRVRYIYLSQLIPYLRSACTVSVGLSWKAGAAAEVIGIPKGSIGEHLYDAKLYLDTPDLFAWTIVIICMSILFERVFLWALSNLLKRLERM